ncbi:MAG: hypothetical protein WC219_05245 [Acholeplasmataceae bacterium]
MKYLKVLSKRLLSGVVEKHLVLPTLAFGIAIVFVIIKSDYRSQVISALVGFVFGKALISLSIAIYYSKEDQRKAIRDYDSLSSFYSEAIYGHKYILFSNEKKIKLFYDELYTHDFKKKIIFDDQPNKRFILPYVIAPYYSDLMQAHKASFTKNAFTIRLDDLIVNKDELILKTSRTTYFDHLVLNRAIDFPVRDILSVRRLFEYNNELTPLKHSKLANQIGVNAIVLFNDGYTIFPRRSFTSTVAKNRITSSLAIRLNSENTFEQITEASIHKDFYKQMVSRLHFPESYISDPSKIDIKLVGIGRDLCEGGKPQFYYVIHLNDISSDDYTKRLNLCIKEKKKDKLTQIDYDRLLYVTKLSDLDLHKNETLKLKPRLYHKRKDSFHTRKISVKVKPEISFYYNLWHYYKIYEPSRIIKSN